MGEAGKPVRLQLLRKRGFNLQALSMATNGLPAVNVARPGRWGNPFRVGDDGNACEVVEKFQRAWDEAICSATTPPRHPPMPFGKPLYIGPLIGKNLACFCGPDEPCHADVLLELANRD